MYLQPASGLSLPERAEKPRARGMTILIDPGLPTRYFQDVVESAAPHIDLVKFGWGTSVITPHLDEKIATLRAQGIDYFFGGTLFEKFYRQKQIGAFVEYCQGHGCRYVEISNGTIDLSNADKARVIADFAGEFRVMSEVGCKDSEQSQMLSPAMWIAYIDLVFEAPNKTLQATFIKRLGPDVNLANVAFADAIALETLRLGLRSDTLLLFD